MIDANLNRLKEGLRVVEDIKRYVFDDAEVAYKIKSLRHKAKIPQDDFLKFRNSQNTLTVGKEGKMKKNILIPLFILLTSCISDVNDPMVRFWNNGVMPS